MVYARTLNPEWFDYRCYESDIDDNIFIDGGKDFADINGDILKKIKTMIDDYQGYYYETYYHYKIKDYLTDMLPKKVNGKKLSPKELHTIKQALDENYHYYSDYEEAVIIVCLSIIQCEPYESFDLKGYCQGEWVVMYAPKDTKQSYVDYIEAIYFGTGTEVEINTENDTIDNPEDICGYTFYTTSYNEEDIKKEVADQTGCNIEDVVLYAFTGTHRVADYKRC